MESIDVNFNSFANNSHISALSVKAILALNRFDVRENERLLNGDPERFYRSKSDRPLSPQVGVYDISGEIYQKPIYRHFLELSTTR